MAEEDRGQGDVDRFSAEDLEKLYRTGATSGIKIRGDALNQVKNTKQYKPLQWYIITEKGVEEA